MPADTDDPAEISGIVHSVETCGTVDGPGVRFVLFTSGCPLRCQYCHNPDSAVPKLGTQRTAADVLEEISRYGKFLKRAKGGVTLSGGEPLQQSRFTKAILEGCKEMGLHTALDTSGFLGKLATPRLLAATDLVLLDIKSFDPLIYKRVTGREVEPTLQFARRLASIEKPLWIRFVLVPGLTDAPHNVRGIAEFVSRLPSVKRVDILPFHKMGEFKWQQLGRSYQLGDTQPPSEEQIESAREEFRKRGLNVH